MEGSGCYLLDLRDPNIGSQRGCGCKNERSDNIPPSAVGEINVVNKMHEVNATLGGEGNGGVILPDLHYGRDALVVLILT